MLRRLTFASLQDLNIRHLTFQWEVEWIRSKRAHCTITFIAKNSSVFALRLAQMFSLLYGQVSLFSKRKNRITSHRVFRIVGASSLLLLAIVSARQTGQDEWRDTATRRTKIEYRVCITVLLCFSCVNLYAGSVFGVSHTVAFQQLSASAQLKNHILLILLLLKRRKIANNLSVQWYPVSTSFNVRSTTSHSDGERRRQCSFVENPKYFMFGGGGGGICFAQVHALCAILRRVFTVNFRNDCRCNAAMVRYKLWAGVVAREFQLSEI